MSKGHFTTGYNTHSLSLTYQKNVRTWWAGEAGVYSRFWNIAAGWDSSDPQRTTRRSVWKVYLSYSNRLSSLLLPSLHSSRYYFKFLFTCLVSCKPDVELHLGPRLTVPTCRMSVACAATYKTSSPFRYYFDIWFDVLLLDSCGSSASRVRVTDIPGFGNLFRCFAMRSRDAGVWWLAYVIVLCCQDLIISIDNVANSSVLYLCFRV